MPEDLTEDLDHQESTPEERASGLVEDLAAALAGDDESAYDLASSLREEATTAEQLAAELDRLPGVAVAEHAAKVRATAAGLKVAADAVEAAWNAVPELSLVPTYVPFATPISTSTPLLREN